MKNIKVQNWKGHTYEGSWNEKVYSSKIEDREDLYRIYVDGDPIHIEKAELERITTGIEQAEKEREQREIENKIRRIKLIFHELSQRDKAKVLSKILNDRDICRIFSDRKYKGPKIREFAEYLDLEYLDVTGRKMEERKRRMKKTIDLLNAAVEMGFNRDQALADIDASLDAELEERQPLMEEEINESLYNDILDGFRADKEANL